MFKQIIGGFLSLAICATASAGLTDLSVDNVIKKGTESYLKIGGLNTTVEYGSLNIGENKGVLTSELANGWTAEIYVTVSDTFKKNARCANYSDCDTAGWKFLELDTSETSRIYNSQQTIILDKAWGQFGYNAGGIHVEETDSLAGGFWLEKWTHTNANGVTRNRTGGDINFQVTSVPEPSTVALLALGLAGLGFSRKNKAA